MKFSVEDLITLIPDKENGLITAKRLATITGHTESFVRKIINEARSRGTPICSTRFGYYYSTEHRDVIDTVEFLTRRVNTQIQAINGLKNIKHKEI